MTLALVFPSIDPVLFEVGPFAVRWYSLAYIAGLMGAWRYMMWMADFEPKNITRDHADDFLVWAIFGVILGGRLGVARGAGASDSTRGRHNPPARIPSGHAGRGSRTRFLFGPRPPYGA